MSGYIELKVLSRRSKIKLFNELIFGHDAVFLTRPPILLIILHTLAIEDYEALSC